MRKLLLPFNFAYKVHLASERNGRLEEEEVEKRQTFPQNGGGGNR